MREPAMKGGYCNSVKRKSCDIEGSHRVKETVQAARNIFLAPA